MKSLVLAEKPSVGKELALTLGCRNYGDHYEGDDYVVTWALGHLVTLCPPDYYGPEFKHWKLSNLPMLPEKLETMVIEKSKDQYRVVKGLLDREDVDTVIIATDAGREGELVARWILQQAKCKKPTKRLWISSQTELAIRQGFANLKDGSEYDNLYKSAVSRSYADWYVGYNVSRAMSCHFDTRLSAGRVQTPTLALMTTREDEIEDFAGRFYWTIKADFGMFKASLYTSDNSIRIAEEAKANEINEKLQNATGVVLKVTEVPKVEKPPLAYDLTQLQRDANLILGFSAKETLDTLQRLYEVHKIVTYPRTDSRYITADIVPTFADRLLALRDTLFAPRAMDFIKNGYRKDLSRLVNDELVSDHHALLPTEQKVDLSALSKAEKDLWELIITRFLETLSEDYEYKTKTVEVEVNGEHFISRLTVPTSQGWRNVAKEIGKKSAEISMDTEDNESGVASLSEGDIVKVQSTVLKRNATLPPERYTEADLLYAMEHAGKFVEDEEFKKHLGNGLGTPATRADIIEKLIQNNCIVRQDRYLVPTPKGRELVRLVPQQLKSAELTGRWEQRLSGISEGTDSDTLFVEDIKKNAAELVKQVIANSDSFDPNLMGEKEHLCPSCSWPMVKVVDEEGREHYVCQKFSCGYEEMKIRKKIGDKVMVAKVVVKESHFRPKTYQNSDRTMNRNYDKSYEAGNNNHTEGGTFADFIKASQERKEHHNSKGKRK